MGWVEQKIADYKATAAALTPLWNSVRDSIGEAVTDFQYGIHMPGVGHTDCRARGKMCVRVQKPGRFIEIFLSDTDQSIKSASGGTDLTGSREDGTILDISRYRLKQDRSGLEFYIEGDGGKCVVLSADDVAKRALEKFLFDPFPASGIITRQPTP